MTPKSGRRILLKLSVTAVLAVVIPLLLLVLHAFDLFAAIAMPVLGLGQIISSWIENINRPTGGVWFPNLGIAVLVDAILVWLYLWAILMIVWMLFDRFIKPRRETA